MRSVLLAIAVTLSVFGIGVSPSHAALTTLTLGLEIDGVDVTGGAYDLAVGDTVAVGIFASESESGLYTAGFDLSFDNSQLLVKNFVIPKEWDQFRDNGVSPGHVRFDAGWNAPIEDVTPDTKTLLATFNLTSIGEGNSDLIMADLDAIAPNWLAGDGHTLLDAQLDPPVVLAGVNSAVPVPGAIWLLGTGLMGLLALGKHRLIDRTDDLEKR